MVDDILLIQGRVGKRKNFEKERFERKEKFLDPTCRTAESQTFIDLKLEQQRETASITIFFISFLLFFLLLFSSSSSPLFLLLLIIMSIPLSTSMMSFNPLSERSAWAPEG